MKPSLVSTIARQVGAVPDGPTRRQFLKTTLAAGAVFMLGGRFGRHFEEGMLMGWPSEKWTRCGYTAPSTGEVTSVYPLLAQGFEDRLFFAGEYSSLLFTGYMEGGLHSGAVLAKRLAGKLNL